MERQNHEFLKTSELQMPDSTERRQEESHGDRSYRAPQLFVIGKAVDLVQQNIDGHLRDGSGGWWVWNS